MRQDGTGSGFIWDSNGHVVTNRHVVAGASAACVRLSDGRDLDASLVGVSAAHDLAVLKVNLSTTPQALPLGSSADLRVGQSTFAIGNPFGLDWTLTTGIVSALDRSLPTEDGRSLIEHLIQTDAAINPGNSGGPLLDSAGRLIGVNTVIYSPSGASAGVGFAIPVDTVNRVVPQLIASGRDVRPALGIEIDDGLNQLITRRLSVAGVVILRTSPGSAASAAGLRGTHSQRDGTIVAGDIILAVNGHATESVARLPESSRRLRHRRYRQADGASRQAAHRRPGAPASQRAVALIAQGRGPWAAEAPAKGLAGPVRSAASPDGGDPRKPASERSSAAACLRELLALQRPLCVLAEPAVLADEPLRALRIAAQLPIEPAHRH